MKWWAALFLPLALCANGFAADISGHIDKNTTWAGDVKLVDTVTVSPGVTLRVDGARVMVAPGRGLIVHGQLIATKSSFTTDSTQPKPAYWSGIRIEPQQFGFFDRQQDASTIQDCQISRAETAIRISGHQRLKSPSISGTTISDCGWGGVVVDETDSALIEKNTIERVCVDRPSDQGRPLAVINCSGAKIVGNTIRNCSDTGVCLIHCDGAEVKENHTQNITGGPGPGLHGYYKFWGLGARLTACQHCQLIGNQFSGSAYIGICIAYGSNDNVARSNRVEGNLDALNVVGPCKNNLFEDNTVSGGWSILYVTGTGSVQFERCNIADPGGSRGGYCFSVRTGEATFRDCKWHARTMNIWGGKVLVDHCLLVVPSGFPAVSLKKDAVGTLIDCDFDQSAMSADAKATGHIDVEHRLTLDVLAASRGAALGGCKVTATSLAAGTRPITAQTDPKGHVVLPLVEFVFSAKGKHRIAPWTIAVEHASYNTQSVSLPMESPSSRKIQLSAAK